MPVRLATERDELAVLGLLRKMHAESVYSTVFLDEHKLRWFLGFVRSHPQHCYFVHERSDATIDGVFIGNVSDYFFSNELGAHDIILYVAQGRRGGVAAYRLWTAFKSWAGAQGAKLIWPGISTGIDVEKTTRFYEKLGMRRVGTVFQGPP